MQSTFGARVAHHRKQLGISQTELARRLGVDGSTISYWESGEKAPRVDSLGDVAKVLGITTAELFLPVPNTAG